MSAQPPPPPAQPPPPPGQPPYAGARPPGLTTAAVLLFIISGLRILLGLFLLVAVLGAQDEIEVSGVSAGTVVGAVTIAVLITLAIGVLQLMSGVAAIRQRRRAFGLGLGGCIAGIVLGLYGLATGGGGTGAIFAVLFLAVDITALVLLVQNRQHLVNP